MTSIQAGSRFVDKVTGYHVTITEVNERGVWGRFDFGDGKCGVVIPRDAAADALREYTPPKE